MIEQWLFQELIYHVWLAKRLNDKKSDIKPIEKKIPFTLKSDQSSFRIVTKLTETVWLYHSFQLKAQNQHENTVMIWILNVQLLVTFENRTFTSPVFGWPKTS